MCDYIFPSDDILVIEFTKQMLIILFYYQLSQFFEFFEW